MDNPFVVTTRTLGALSGKDAEELVRRMIVAEADSAGAPRDGIRDGGKSSSPDGGVDFEVRDAPRESAAGLIKQGRTLYQVKSGRFSPTQGVHGILFKKDGDVRDSVRECLEAGGTLTVVLTAWGGAGTKMSDLGEKFVEALRGKISRKASVQVWTPAMIADLLELHPHLALFANSAYPEGLFAHDAWSRLVDMSLPFRPGRGEDEFMRRLRGRLLDDNPLHVRVTGEPGSGKTRLVLEATRDERLRRRVVYAEGPDSIQPLLNQVCRGGTGGRASSIVVVDDCGKTEQADIWNKLKNSSQIRLVTIHSEADVDRPSTAHMPVPPLADAQLREIISAYTGGDGDAKAWIEYCRASPRAAHIVGANLRDNPDDMLRAPDYVAVWNRYLAGQGDQKGDDFKIRKVVLEWLSLFKTFGYGGIYGHELDRIAGLAEKDDHVPIGEFKRVVRELHDMKILQGTSMLYITPKLLHIHMWTEWWKRHGTSAAPRADQIVGRGEVLDGSQNLLQWYLDMFRYARHAPEASKVVEGMLRPGGFLDSDDVLGSQLGADFFLTLSSVDPKSSLACIERIVGRLGSDSAGALAHAPPNVVHALSQMLSHEAAFTGALRLLLRFAVAAGGVGAARAYAPNPALDAYCNALDPANSGVSAPPRIRLALLGEALRSPLVDDRLAAVHACAAVLAMRRHAIVIPRCRGFERVPEPWVPKDRSEAVSYYQGVFDLLRAAALDSGDVDVQRDAAAAAVETMHQTLLVPELSQPVVDLLAKLAASGAVDKAKLLGRIELLLDADSERIDPGAAEGMSSLRDAIVGSGFSAEMRRHVGRYARRGLSMGERGDRTEDVLGDLAGRAVRDDALLPELAWLVTGEAVNGIEFGHEVGKRDPDTRWLGRILEAMRRAGPRATALLLSGYLLSAYEGHRTDLDGLLDRLLGDAVLCVHVPEITWRTGITDRSLGRLTSGVSAGKLGIESVQLLRYGHRMRDASAGAVAGLASAILEACGQDARAGATALDIVHSYFVAGTGTGDRDPVPDELALAILLHRGLIDAPDGDPPDHVTSNAWRELASLILRRGGDAGLALAGAMIDRFGASALLHAPGPEPPSTALAEIAVSRPREVWQMIAARLLPPLDQRALQLLAWIGAGGGSRSVGAKRVAAALVPWIVAWVEEDPPGRAGRMARHLPPIFPAIRGFVARFGDREDVRNGLATVFVAGVFRGSVASYYADKKKEAQALSKGEEDMNVLLFLDHYVSFLEDRMEGGAAAEERLAAGLA